MGKRKEKDKIPLDLMPEFLTTSDLISLGLFSGYNSIYQARIKGYFSDYLKVGRKILYPKKNIIKFINSHLKNGSDPYKTEPLDSPLLEKGN